MGHGWANLWACVNTPPQIDAVESVSINLPDKNWWRGRGSPFVKMSAIWRPEEMNGREMTPRRYSSRMKWQSTSMCLVRSWKTGFSVIRIALVLSAWRGVGECCGKSRSESSPRTQSISAQASDMARYSASVEDLETLACFLHFQDINASPRYIHHPVVERRVSGQPA